MPGNQSPVEILRELFRNAEVFPYSESTCTVPTGKSQQSQESQALHVSFKLNASEIDDFNERAAILEFDGGLARDAAEARALAFILAGRRRRTSAV